MKLLFTILIFVSFTQLTHCQPIITVLSQNDSLAIVGVICTNSQNQVVGVSDRKGKLNVSKNGKYLLIHPSFYAVQLNQLKNDSVVYLHPLIREIEEVEIVTTTNEKLFGLVIQKYRHDIEYSTRKGTLNYKNTNWFTYDYLEERKRDSAYCAIENTLSFEVNQTKKKNKILFSPVALSRYCIDFSFPRNAGIKTAEMSGFSKFDFSRFLNAIFTERSFFDEIGFSHTQTTKRIDEMNKTIELKFLTEGYEKTIVFSAIDSSLISYKYHYSGSKGLYHVYFATFSNQEVQTFYEEKGYLFDYEKQNHLFHSIHYGSFKTDNEVELIDPTTFSNIISSQSDKSTLTIIEALYPRNKNVQFKQ